jgi:plastocyanin
MRQKTVIGMFHAAAVLVAASATTSGQVVYTVDLAGESFVPGQLTIDMGDTVRWEWISGIHNVESGTIVEFAGVFDGNFRSGDPTGFVGSTFDFTFDEAFLAAHPMSENRYPYYCVVHALVDMSGTITVRVPSCTSQGDCSDSDPCTADACVSGECEFSPITDCCRSDNDCDDGNACNGMERCTGRICANGDPLICDDGNACTDDRCVAGECTFPLIPACCLSDADCDDVEPCTSDHCIEHVCVQTPEFDCVPCALDADCENGSPCTDHACTDGVCTSGLNTATCDDGDVCTTGDSCSNGNCVGMPIEGCCRADADCDDGDNATVHACVHNICEAAPNDDEPSPDGDPPAGQPEPDDANPSGRGGLCGAIGMIPLCCMASAVLAAHWQRRRNSPCGTNPLRGKAGEC